MKILVLTNLYPPYSIGGYEERCRQVMDRMRQRGHEVRILTSTHGLSGEQCDGSVHRRFRIHGFFGHPWLPIHQLYALEKHNHEVLRSECSEFRPDIVHVWNLGGLSKSLILTLQALSVPVVYDVSDHWIARSLKADVWLSWWNGNTGGRGAAWIRSILHRTGWAERLRHSVPFAPWTDLRFERIYFCSQALRDLTQAKGYAVDHAAIIYCGIPTDRFHPRPANDRFTRLLYVGRLAEDKDPLTAVRALRLLPPRFTLSLYGKGSAEETALLRAEAEPLGDRVQFGSAGPEEMPSVYAAHDALLFTSAWAEPFALTPLEAMASEVPVISTLEGGSRELIRHGENALSYRTGDASDLASQILRLDEDSHLRSSLVKTAAAEVRTKYDLEVIVSQIEDYLRATLSSS